MSQEVEKQSWWEGLNREEFSSSQKLAEERMRNTRLPKPVTLALQAQEFLEEAELRGFNTPRQSPPSTTPSR
jgi:hypothetical protein